MASLGSYKVPKKLKDEDKWFKFFTKTQLLVMLIALMLGIVGLVAFVSIGMVVLGILFLLLPIIVAAICVFFKIPEDKYLIGGGEYIGTILLLLLRKQLPGQKVLFLSNYDDNY